MKRRLSILITIILTSILCINVLDVSAGTVNINIEGNPTVVVGNTIDLTVKASDITGFDKGLATVQGDLVFDNSYLEYVKYTNASSSLSSSYGTTTQRFVSLGMGGEYISSSGNLITITFRAKQIGTTEVSIKDIVVGDTKAIPHTANASSKTVEIIGESKEPDVPKKDPDKGGSNTPTKKPNNNNSNSSSKSNNNDLESLTINNAKISPTFSKSTTTYQVTIPSDVSKLELDYKLSDGKATVKVVGNSDLNGSGSHVVKIIVTAEDGTVKTYTLNVEKSKDSSNNKLESLKIKESSLSPKFDSDINEYSIRLDKNVKKLTIDAIAKDKNSKVEIIDNKDLDRNNSIVLIKVTDKNGFSNYYKLKVEHGRKRITLFGINIIYIVFGLLFLIFLLFIILLLLKRRDDDDNDGSRRVANNDLYDDVVTKDELVDAITERDPKKLKMLLTQEEANKLKEEVKQQERELTKEELLRAIEENDKKKIMELVDREKLDKKSKSTDYVMTEDDLIKEEIIKAIEERDTSKLKMIVKQEEANRLKDELRDSKK